LALPSVRRRHPIAPRFPYTTLVRSAVPRGVSLDGRELHGDPCWGELLELDHEVLADREGAPLLGVDHVGALGDPGDHMELGGLEDRKSTRLNSSHVKISYAVFCLKK